MADPHLVQDLEAALDEAQGRAPVPRALLVHPTIEGLIALAVIDWVVILGCWGIMALSPWWVWPPLMVVCASRFHGLGVILHDAAHMAIANKTPGVRLLELLCGYPLATTLDAMRYHHLRHHRDSGMPTDPYFKPGVGQSTSLYWLNVARGLMLMPFWSVRPWFGIAAYWSPGLRPAYARIFLQDRSDRAETGLPRDLVRSREVEVCAREEHGQAAFQVILLSLFWEAPGAFVVGYGLPVVGAGVLAAWRLLQEHRYEPASDRSLSTILATTRDHHLHRAWAWLLAPHHIGYHVVHHLHPSVSLTALPALRAWYQANVPGYPR
jgi:fatty acid desaturase